MVVRYRKRTNFNKVDAVNAYVPPFPTSWCIAYWKFDEASGNASDSSWSWYTLTNTWTVTYSAGKINNWITTSAGKYMTHTTFLDAWLTAWSVSIWFKSSTTWTWKSMFMKETPWYSALNIAFFNDDYLYFYLSWGSSTGHNVFKSTSNGLLDWNWHHVVCMWDNSGRASMAMYVDWSSTWAASATDGYNSWAIIADTSEDFQMGQRPSNDRPYAGQIDEVGVWDRVLTSDEITQLFNWWNWISF